MSFEEMLRQIVREEIRTALSERLPPTTPAIVLYEKIPAFATRIDVSERTVWTWIKKGMPVIGEGKSRRVDVQAATQWLRGQRDVVDDSVERDAARRARAAIRLVK